MQRSSRFWMGAALTSLIALTPALAQDAGDPNAPSTQGNVSVTVYNGGTSLVQDIRKLNIASGTSRIEFPDVSAQISPRPSASLPTARRSSSRTSITTC